MAPGSTCLLIRKADEADRNAVWSFVQELAVTFVPERAAYERMWESSQTRDDALLLIAEQDDRSIGYLLAHLHPTLFANAPVVWIEELFVRDQVRRRGVGSALVSAAEAWAGRREAAYVSLATRRAAAFYAGLGYEESATFFRKVLPGPSSGG